MKFKDKFNKHGFTLAELLIVVAIVGVLVAISIPIFSGKKQQSIDATNKANIRSAMSIAFAEYLSEGKTDTGKYLYNVYEEKLYDFVKIKNENHKPIANNSDPLPNRSHKTGLYVGIYVLIDIDDPNGAIKTYPYADEDGEIVFDKQGVVDWDVWGGDCDAVSPKYAYENAGVNHFSN